MSLPNQDNPGVLILSEMADASVELSDALLINPNDTDQIEQAICRALKMPLEEQRERLQRMQAILSVQTVNKWAADFMREWRQAAEKNKRLQKKKISAQDQNEIKTLYDQAKKRLILLDYDGTLTAFKIIRKMQFQHLHYETCYSVFVPTLGIM